MFPELWDKIGVLIHSIIAFHPFSDGNKRTVLVAADVCLLVNGYRIVPSAELG
jgi:death-on-curing protein